MYMRIGEDSKPISALLLRGHRDREPDDDARAHLALHRRVQLAANHGLPENDRHLVREIITWP